MTEAQEKNHTDPIDLSSRTPLGQLMWRAVTYTHQAGADGSTAPLPSRKKILVIFGSPLVWQCTNIPYRCASQKQSQLIIVPVFHVWHTVNPVTLPAAH